MSSAGQQLVAGRIPGETIGVGIEDSDSSNFTTTETAVASVVVGLVAGRTYQISWMGNFQSSVSGDRLQVNLRENNASGTVMQSGQLVISTTASGVGYPISLESEFTAAVTGAKTFVCSAVRLAGSGNCRLEAATGRAAYLRVRYDRG